MGANIRAVSGPAIEKAGDLASILTSLSEGDIFFIDECHALNRIIEEYLYSAMEDFKLNLIIGRGPMAQTMELELPKFTLIGATIRIGKISSPLRDRFGAIHKLDYYKLKDIKKIIKRSAKILKIDVDNVSASLIDSM